MKDILPIHQLHQKRLRGDLSTKDINQKVLNQIKKHQQSINAYIFIQNEENILKKAEKIDEQIKKGNEVSPLAGMPIGVKDIFLTKGIETTCASEILKDFIPPYESSVTEKCIQQDYNLVGKLNMDEFAMGATNKNSVFGPVCNPWNLKKISGGSSGGSAAALAAKMCVASLGTDTGGSIRQPAAYNSVVGLKPTYGRVSRYGIIAYASSLDQAGPFCQDVKDTALMLEAISGFDPKDATSLQLPKENFYKDLKEIPPQKIGIIQNLKEDLLDKEILENYQENIAFFEKQGIEIIPLNLPLLDYSIEIYYIIACSEASSNLGRFDGIRYGNRKEANNLLNLYKNTRQHGFGEEVKLRILTGVFALSTGYYDAYYNKARSARTQMTKQMQEAFTKVDFILSPITPELPSDITNNEEDPTKNYLLDLLTTPANLGGFPAMSLPSGFSKNNLPIGIQFCADRLKEQKLLGHALWYENNFPAKKIDIPI